MKKIFVATFLVLGMNLIAGLAFANQQPVQVTNPNHRTGITMTYQIVASGYQGTANLPSSFNLVQFPYTLTHGSTFKVISIGVLGGSATASPSQVPVCAKGQMCPDVVILVTVK
jgi:hypothetical protein